MIPLGDTARRRIGYGLVGAILVTTAAYLAFGGSTETTQELTLNALLAVVFATVIALSIRAAPRNGAVWALAWGAVTGIAGSAAGAIVSSRGGFGYEEIELGSVTMAPSDLDLLTSLAANLALWAWVPSIFLFTIHAIILFPRGYAVSRRWRAVAWIAGLSIAIMVTAGFLRHAPWVDTPFSVMYPNEFGVLGPAGLLMLVLLVIAPSALVHLVIRYRKSTGEERAQYRWVTWALGANVVSIFTFELHDAIPLDVGLIVISTIPIAFGIAITKYRLFDIDIVISRSLMFVGLAGVITLIYATVVVGIGSLIGGSSTWLSILATVIVAVVFEPARHRLQRWVNRIVYGRRATPYEVLSDLTERLVETESAAGLLPRMARRLQEGTGADVAHVWLASDGGFRLAASSNEEESRWVDGLDAIDGDVIPVSHEGDVLGALSIEKRRGEALTPTERRLVDDLAGSAGLLLRRRRLDDELERTARELSESRRRLVNAQDVERRRLEQELHVGPEQQVLGLKLGLAEAAETARREGTERTADLVDQISDDAQHAIEQIRSLAQGIYPPLLESEGLVAAIAALADRTPLDVRTSVTVDRRFPLPVEAATFFCVSEALTNAAKHGAAPIEVRVFDTDGRLMFEVADSGPGFAPDTVPGGSGLANMADRLDALGGELEVSSSPGTRTVVRGTLPVEVPVIA